MKGFFLDFWIYKAVVILIERTKTHKRKDAEKYEMQEKSEVMHTNL